MHKTKAAGVTAAPPARTYAGQAHAERVAERRRRFIDAGIELFGTVGYRATTMRMLTAAAGLTNRYFYESFGSMEDLLVACYERVMADYRVRLQAVLDASPGDLEAQIRSGARCFFEAMRDPHFARITQVEVVGVSPRIDALYVRAFREFGALLAQYIGGAEKPGPAVTPRERELIGQALAGAMSMTGALWMRSRYRDGIDVVVEAAVTILLGTARQLQAG